MTIPWAQLLDQINAIDRRPREMTAPLEKTPLETYVPPAKPSLIGLSRARAGRAAG